MNGLRKDISPADLTACAATASINAARARNIINKVIATVADRPRFAEVAEVAYLTGKSIDPNLGLAPYRTREHRCHPQGVKT